MDEVNQYSVRTSMRRLTRVVAAIGGAGAIALALPAAAGADPVNPAPGPATPAPGATAPGAPNAAGPAPGAGAPGAPNAGTPAGAPVAEAGPGPGPGPAGVAPQGNDPAPVDPNAGRIDNPVGGFSFVLPAGWVESDATHLDYGSALLSKISGPPSQGQPPPVANDTRIVLGRLDQKLYASAEADNTKAATRLASDMGEFFMPYPGTRVNQETIPLGVNGATGGASFYEVKFSDATKPSGQIWAGVVSAPGPAGPATQRWFVVWLGTSNTPVDKAGAKTLAESVRPLSAPAAAGPVPGGPAPGAVAPGGPAPGGPAPGAVAPGGPAPGAVAPGGPVPGGPAPGAVAPGGPAPGGPVPGAAAPGGPAPGGPVPGAAAPGGPAPGAVAPGGSQPAGNGNNPAPGTVST